jgi:hypothetical protein
MFETTKTITVQLSDENNTRINDDINNFVHALRCRGQSIDYYEKKRDVSKDTAIIDSLLGKKGEFFASWGLHYDFKIPLLKPDLRIYTKKDKSWDCDLLYEKDDTKIGFHVKTCNLWGLKFCKDFSWTFQLRNRDNSGGTDAIFQPSVNDFVVLVYVNEYSHNVGMIKAILPVEKVLCLLKDPIMEKHRGFKKCIYYTDILAESH